jgi:hypothetical protein
MLSEQDITDLKIILKEQREYIDNLFDLISDIQHKSSEELYTVLSCQGVLEDVFGCNKVMVEIIEGPSKLL